MLGFLRNGLTRAKLRRAVALASAGRHTEAEAAYCRALRSENLRAEALAGLARLAHAQGALPQAAERWQECLAAAGPGARADWVPQLVAIAGLLDNLDDAGRLLTQAADLFPDRVEPQAGLARVAAARSLWSDAADRWDAVAARFPCAMTAADSIAHATSLMRCGRFEAADAVATALISAHPGRAEVWRLHARIAATALDQTMARTRWIEARNGFPAATERVPEHRRLSSLWEDDYSMLADAGTDAASALFRLKMLQAYQFSNEAAAAARLCMVAYPGEVEIQLAGLRALHGAASGPGELEEARGIAIELRERFARSRAVRLAELQLAARLRDTKAVTAAIAGFTACFGDSADVLPFRSWLAQEEGDFDAARAFDAAHTGQRFVPALRSDLAPPSVIGPREAPILRDRIIVLTHARNEIGFVRWFLDCYRRLGVDWFYVIDDGSTDGTAEVLLAQPDVTVYRSEAAYAMSNDGAAWINQLLDLHGAGNWCVVVDLDEQLVMPELRDRSLRSILDEMEVNGEHAMAGFMLDMFPESIAAAAGFAPGDDPLAIAPWFDTDYFFPGHWQAPLSWAGGGARARLFGQRHNCMAKTPIVRGGAGLRYLWKHHVSPTRASARSCSLLHYKVLQNVVRLRNGDVESDRHVKDNLWLGHRRRGDRIADVIAQLSPQDPLVGATSARFRDAAQLADLGLLPHLANAGDRGDLPAALTGATEETLVEAVRLAVSATRRQDWREAARRWEACLSRPDAGTRALWHARHGLARLRLGETAAAKSSFRIALAQEAELDDLADGLTLDEATAVGLPVR
ncbi:glycosyltransferase family 2 protein [Aquibium sp. ELW1220]|uniref:glycosyltransferase family 2 protein n=1 Tax=Aquibium sp. ELW1220 TaxID=2976766 RepID=UPI0025B006F7|nr:glycosyltransferase family 2 protein [Aquibium sp. ELW1220]MDN2584212.1 glycosyltransferase family 2 protein [Aquibium sp. ELW1220]